MRIRTVLEPAEQVPGSRNLIGRRSFCLQAIAALARDSVAVTMEARNGKVTTVKHGSGDERRAETPGSVIKPLVLTALLNAGLLQARETFLCSRKLIVNGRQLHCVHPNMATPMNIERAIAYSCNCAVAHWSARAGAPDLANRLRATGLPINGPLSDVRLLALGEEGVRVSALQLAQAYRRAQFPKEIWAGMEGAVRYGTAQLAALPNMLVAGKTGSGGTSVTGRVAWFAGFAPSRTPEFVTVVMAAGGSGGADAAPIARRLWLDYLGSRA